MIINLIICFSIYGAVSCLSYVLVLCRSVTPDWYHGIPDMFENKRIVDKLAAAMLLYIALPAALPKSIKDLWQRAKK
jgi:hypothetical protein